MNCLHPPERLDKLAREYALGTLSGGARRRFERALRQSPQAEKLFFKVSRLAVSYENAPASAGQVPTEPLVLSGHCVKLW